MALAWPLVGRDAEIERLHDAVDADDRRGVLIVGDAGVGKTRLADEALRAAAERGWGTVWVSASSAARQIPLGAFAPTLPAVGDDRHGLLQWAADALLQRARGRGLVIGVDDANQLDDASVALVYLVATRDEFRLVMTARADELAPSSVLSLWKDGVVERLDVGPLDEDATRTLVRAVLGKGLTARVSERLWQLSRGNALFLRELVMAAVERREQGEAGPVTLAESARGRLRDLIEARIGFLDDTAREALEMVALGEPLPLALAESVVEPDALERLEQRTLVETRHAPAGSTVRTAHPMYGEVLRQSIRPLRRRAIFRRLAAWDPDRADSFDLLRRAAWRLEADDRAAPGEFLHGARVALARLDPALAERLARAAQEAGLAEATPVLGEALRAQGRNPEAETLLGASRPAEVNERVRNAIARATNLFWGLRDTNAALDVLGEAERDAADSPALVAECWSQRAPLLFFCGRFDEGIGAAERVLASTSSTDVAKARCAPVISGGMALRGEFDAAALVFDEWLEPAGAMAGDALFADLQLRIVHALTLMWSGRLQEGRSFVSAQLGLDLDDPPAPLASLIAGGRGLERIARGHAVEAHQELTTALDLSAEGDWFGVRPAFQAILARAEVMVGETEVARRSLTASEAVFGSESARTAMFRPEIEHTKVWLLFAEGRRDDAVNLAVSVADREASGMAAVAVHVLHLLGRSGYPQLALPRLEALRACVDGPAIDLAIDHLGALGDRDAIGLERAGAELEAFGHELIAAEAWRSAAVVHHGAVRGAAALRAERRARDLLEQCANPWSPGLELEPFTGAAGLTEREREVAVLAARGLRSQEIGARLEVSVRTVDTHLARVYRKLAIRGRVELASALGLG